MNEFYAARLLAYAAGRPTGLAASDQSLAPSSTAAAAAAAAAAGSSIEQLDVTSASGPTATGSGLGVNSSDSPYELGRVARVAGSAAAVFFRSAGLPDDLMAQVLYLVIGIGKRLNPREEAER